MADERKKRMEEELAKLGIYTVDDLNEAIKKEKPLDLSLMLGKLDTVQNAGFRCAAAIAAVAEHSIMRQFAAGRPDEYNTFTLKTE